MSARFHGLAVAALLALSVAGCARGSSSSPASGHPGAAPRLLGGEEYTSGIVAQEQALSDGTVSKGEYELAVERFTECLTSNGLQVDNLGWDPVTHQQIRVYYRSDDRSADEVDGYGFECMEAHVMQVSEAYTDSIAPVMADDLMVFAQRCLNDRGIVTTGRETSVTALRTAASSRDHDVTECVVNGLTQLYPDSPAVVSD